jgi:hypothetical protein
MYVGQHSRDDPYHPSSSIAQAEDVDGVTAEPAAAVSDTGATCNDCFDAGPTNDFDAGATNDDFDAGATYDGVDVGAAYGDVDVGATHDDFDVGATYDDGYDGNVEGEAS